MSAVMQPSATAEDIEHVVEVLRLHNLKAQISQGEERTVIGVIGTGFPDDLLETLEVLPGVDRVTRITRPFKLASRDFKPADTVVEAGGQRVGGREFVVMAGPCSVESREQLLRTAESVAASAAIEEWLMAAEYIMVAGNPNVILCERGIRTFETATRNTLDLSAIPLVKRLSHLPILADPSHGTGHRYLVQPMALAAAVAGADGIIVEVHPEPDSALSDGPQSLTLEGFQALMRTLANVLAAVDRPLARSRQPLLRTA